MVRRTKPRTVRVLRSLRRTAGRYFDRAGTRISQEEALRRLRISRALQKFLEKPKRKPIPEPVPKRKPIPKPKRKPTPKPKRKRTQRRRGRQQCWVLLDATIESGAIPAFALSNYEDERASFKAHVASLPRGFYTASGTARVTVVDRSRDAAGKVRELEPLTFTFPLDYDAFLSAYYEALRQRVQTETGAKSPGPQVEVLLTYVQVCVVPVATAEEAAVAHTRIFAPDT